MPRVKIDYVVSFSSEDPENRAQNLVSREVGRGRWLGARGEPACSVVLQLARAVTVLIPSSVFLSPRESREAGGAAAERVRSFERAAMSEAARAQCWDRLRLVCTQPYNKHCKFGISFVHIFEPEEVGAGVGGARPAVPVPAAVAPAGGLRALAALSDEEDEEFRPGELFAQHRRAADADTGAQIRQASSQALRKDPNAATKLMKTPIPKHKPGGGGRGGSPPGPRGPRDAPALVYAAEDARPHARIDHVVQQHNDEKRKHDEKRKEEKNKNDPKTTRPPAKPKESDKADNTTSKMEEPSSSRNSERKKENGTNDSKRDRDDSRKNINQNTAAKPKEIDKGVKTPSETTSSRNSEKKEQNGRNYNKRDRKDNDQNEAHSSRRDDENRKRTHSNKKEGRGGAPLAGVVFVLSGYENPRRARLRDLAVSLGARAAAAWGPHCTHLICAFPNTPKMREVRAAPGGARVPAARGEWLEACARAGRRLPWRAHAADPATRCPDSDSDSAHDECDTDDEIEKVLQRQKKRRVSSSSRPRDVSPSPLVSSPSPRAPRDDDDDFQFVRDERLQGNVTLEESDSCETEGEGVGEGSAAGEREALPALLGGLAFLVEPGEAAPLDARLLARYARAYGGHVLTAAEAEDGATPHYVLSAGGRRGRAQGEGAGVRLRADWVWACHRAQALLPTEDYLLSA